MLQGEHSAILSTFIKLPVVIKLFVLSICEWPFYTLSGLTVDTVSEKTDFSLTWSETPNTVFFINSAKKGPQNFLAINAFHRGPYGLPREATGPQMQIWLQNYEY